MTNSNEVESAKLRSLRAGERVVRLRRVLAQAHLSLEEALIAEHDALREWQIKFEAYRVEDDEAARELRAARERDNMQRAFEPDQFITLAPKGDSWDKSRHIAVTIGAPEQGLRTVRPICRAADEQTLAQSTVVERLTATHGDLSIALGRLRRDRAVACQKCIVEARSRLRPVSDDSAESENDEHVR